MDGRSGSKPGFAAGARPIELATVKAALMAGEAER